MTRYYMLLRLPNPSGPGENPEILNSGAFEDLDYEPTKGGKLKHGGRDWIIDDVHPDAVRPTLYLRPAV